MQRLPDRDALVSGNHRLDLRYRCVALSSSLSKEPSATGPDETVNPPTAVAEPWSMRVDLRDVRSLERDTEFLRVLTDMIGATVFWEGRLCVRPQLTGVFSTFENPLTREADGHPGPRFLLLCATHRRTARNSWSSTRQQIGRLSRRIVPTACGRGRKRELGNICCRIIRSVHIPPCPASVAIAYARSDYP